MATKYTRTLTQPRKRFHPGSHGEDPDSGVDRFNRDREWRIKDKQIHPERGDETDRQSKAFEVFVCKALNLPPEAWPGDDGPRHGSAFYITHYGKPLGIKPYLILNPAGDNLILSPGQERHPAESYVVGKGSIEHGFRIVGWATHEDVLNRPRREFNKNGFGPRPCMQVRDLRSFDELSSGAGKMF